MRFFTACALAALAVAAPLAAPEVDVGVIEDIHAREVEARQLASSSNELETGSASACPKAILIHARGSTETGTLGTLGVPLGNALERKYGGSAVWVQGVGGPYDASLAGNFQSRGSTPAAIAEMVRLFQLANTKCPNAAIVASGYSQGAALAAAAITDVSSTIREKIVGTVLFGYTKNQQNKGGVPSYPQDRLQVFCAPGDLVCTGSLTITIAHLSYSDEAANEAPAFLISKIGS